MLEEDGREDLPEAGDGLRETRLRSRECAVISPPALLEGGGVRLHAPCPVGPRRSITLRRGDEALSAWKVRRRLGDSREDAGKGVLG